MFPLLGYFELDLLSIIKIFITSLDMIDNERSNHLIL